GIFDRYNHQFIKFNGNEAETHIPLSEIEGFEELITKEEFVAASDELDLLNEAGNQFSLEAVLRGEQTPVFFGSAIAPFGVQDFFDTFITLAPTPGPRKATEGIVAPDDTDFSGFIFKIQANMNPAHRDRIAFVRICSGKFERGMSVKLSRTGKVFKLAQSQQIVASSRDTIDEAYAGDIIGIYDPNAYQIGDTLIEGKANFEFDELPKFPPELFKKVMAKNVMKSKQFKKGI